MALGMLVALSLDGLKRLDIAAQLKLVRSRRAEIDALEAALLAARKAHRR